MPVALQDIASSFVYFPGIVSGAYPETIEVLLTCNFHKPGGIS